MRRSSSRGRGQAEPTVTLAAVLAIVLGLTAYAIVLADAVPDRDRDLAEPTLVRAHDQLTSGGVADPSRLEFSRDEAPAGYDVNLTLETGDRRWAVGPLAPPSADVASRSVGVRLRPGTVRPATLAVEVWP